MMKQEVRNVEKYILFVVFERNCIFATNCNMELPKQRIVY